MMQPLTQSPWPPPSPLARSGRACGRAGDGRAPLTRLRAGVFLPSRAPGPARAPHLALAGGSPAPAVLQPSFITHRRRGPRGLVPKPGDGTAAHTELLMRTDVPRVHLAGAQG